MDIRELLNERVILERNGGRIRLIPEKEGYAVWKQPGYHRPSKRTPFTSLDDALEFFLEEGK